MLIGVVQVLQEKFLCLFLGDQVKLMGVGTVAVSYTQVSTGTDVRSKRQPFRHFDNL
jgi:hypothetical protein